MVITPQNGQKMATIVLFCLQKAGEYDQEIPKSHTTDQPTHHEEEPQNKKQSQGTRKANKVKQLAFSSPSR